LRKHGVFIANKLSGCVERQNVFNTINKSWIVIVSSDRLK